VEGQLGDIGDIRMCKRIFNEETSVTGEVPFYKIGSFGKKADAFISRKKYLEYKQKFSFPSIGNILISAAGTIGRTVVYNGEDAYFQDSNIVWIDNDNSNVIDEFLFYILHIVKFNTEGGTIQRLYNNILKSTTFSYPGVVEQNKIVKFLMLIDQRIQTQSKIIKELKAFKVNLTRLLFSEKSNRINIWTNTKLKDLCGIYDGTHQTPVYVKKGIPFYSVEHVTANQFDKTKYISIEVFEKENKRVKLEKGDILMTRIGSIGSVKYIDWDVDASFYVSLALIKGGNKINNEYLSHFIKSDFFQTELWKRTIHVAFPQKINLSEIGECNVRFPDSEQQGQFARILSKVEKKIEIEQLLINELRKQKEVLVKKMFI
jgi:type I restriction enzyme S subunit